MTVTWQDVAQKDFEDAVRSRLLWGLTIAFIGLMGIFLLVFVSTEGGEIDPLEALVFLGSWSQFFVPLIALIVGYMSIVGERQSGSLRILMSYPFTRKAIVCGKVIGRTVVISLTIAIGFGLMFALALAFLGIPPLIDALAIILLTVGLGLTFTAMAVGISAGTKSRGIAMALAVGMFFLLFVMWEAVAVAAYYLVHGARPGLTVDGWYLFIKQLNPIEAFRMTLTAIAGDYVWPLVNLGLEDIPMDIEQNDRMVAERVSGSTPWYLHPAMSGLVFLGWIVIPLLWGYRRFRRSDIE